MGELPVKTDIQKNRQKVRPSRDKGQLAFISGRITTAFIWLIFLIQPLIRNTLLTTCLHPKPYRVQ
jgi:hypothetical protein